MIELLSRPWPWYVAGPAAGLMVPLLLLAGNKHFGVSASLRQVCAACIPAGVGFFQYDWKKESWNLFFVSGIIAGGVLTRLWLNNPDAVAVNPRLISDLSGYGITDFRGLVSVQLFNWDSLFSLRGFVVVVAGGFLVGFGSRYAGGCTSGHMVMGLSELQVPSLIATLSFMAGGFIMANLLMPAILSL